MHEMKAKADDKLRKQCVEWLRFNSPIKLLATGASLSEDIDSLMSLCKRMQAVGLMEAKNRLATVSQDWDYIVGIDEFLEWCESQARERQGGEFAGPPKQAK